MANTNYTKSYSILGVFQVDDWETIRAAYKRQIRRWHPDRFQDPDHWKIAEEKSKEINRAYQDLADYYQEFGVLPPDQTPERSPAPTTQREWADTVQPAEPRHDDYSGDHRTSFEEPERPGHRDFKSYLNPESLVAVEGCLLEPSLADADRDARFQFEREGYFWQDSRDSTPERPVYNRIVTLRDSWAKIESKGAP